MTQVNINQRCTVILQQRGIKALDKFYRDLGLEQPKLYAVGDKYTAPLFDIMNIFGNYTYMGPLPPFDTVIKLEAL